MNDYLYIALFVIILALAYYYFHEQADTDYLKAFQKVKGEYEITVFIFSAPCDRTKYTLYGTERNIKTNKGAGFPDKDYFDTKHYLSLKERDDMIDALSKEGWVEVHQTTNSDGKTSKLEKIKFFSEFDKSR